MKESLSLCLNVWAYRAEARADAMWSPAASRRTLIRPPSWTWFWVHLASPQPGSEVLSGWDLDSPATPESALCYLLQRRVSKQAGCAGARVEGYKLILIWEVRCCGGTPLRVGDSLYFFFQEIHTVCLLAPAMEWLPRNCPSALSVQSQFPPFPLSWYTAASGEWLARMSGSTCSPRASGCCVVGRCQTVVIHF